MEFTQNDRDMLKAHDLKLKTLCSTTEDMNKTLKNIDEKLGDGAVDCITNRADCRKEVDKEFVRAKTFWGVITVLIFGFLAKIFLIK